MQLHRTRTEIEIVTQAKQMLAAVGVAGASLLQSDVERLSRGLSGLYLSDFGLHEERLASDVGMTQQKPPLQGAQQVQADIAHTANKHIYMCQIPSQITRASPAGVHVCGLRSRLAPADQYRHTYRGKVNSRSDASFNHSMQTSPRAKRRPVVMVGERLEEAASQRRGVFGSCEHINRSRENLHRSQESLIQSHPNFGRIDGVTISMRPTRERVL